MRLEPVKNGVFDFIGRNVDPSRWCYHSRIHTRWVLEDVTLFATRSKVGEAELLRLQVAALFHDTGYSRGGRNHEAASAAIAVTVLPRFGFPKEELNRIAALILATEFPPRPRNFSEELLCDADMGRNGADDFPEAAALLRKELAAGGWPMNDAEWVAFETAFLLNFRYFTPAAQELRGAGVMRNLERLKLEFGEKEL